MARPDTQKIRADAAGPDRRRIEQVEEEDGHPRGRRTLPHDEIAERAYEIFLARGSEEGHALDDWLEAERMLMRRTARHDRFAHQPH